jgi:hypothetical protein
MAVRLPALRAGLSLPPRKLPVTHFCYMLSRPQGHSAAGRVRSSEKSKDLIGIRTRDLPACSIVQSPHRENLKSHEWSMVGPLIKVDLSSGPNRVGVSHSPTWKWKHILFPKRCSVVVF